MREASSSIKMVRENLGLSMALWTAAQRGSITAAYFSGLSEYKSFTNEMVEVAIPLEVRDNRDLARSLTNQLRCSFAFSAIQTHRSLQMTYTGDPLQEPDPDLKAARCSLYVMTKTVSLNLIYPVWTLPIEYRHRFEVRSASFILDAVGLHGKEVYWEDFGGLNRYMELLGYCVEQVEKNTGLTEELTSVTPAVPAPQEEAPPSALEDVGEFVRECCAMGPSEMVIAGNIYSAYTKWRRQRGQEPLPQRSFGMQLTALGFERRRRGKGRHWWVGVGLAAS